MRRSGSRAGFCQGTALAVPLGLVFLAASAAGLRDERDSASFHSHGAVFLITNYSLLITALTSPPPLPSSAPVRPAFARDTTPDRRASHPSARSSCAICAGQ